MNSDPGFETGTKTRKFHLQSFVSSKRLRILDSTLFKNRLLFLPEFCRGKSCLGQTQPEQGAKPPYPGVDIVRSVLSNMKTPVYLLDITLPSQLRIDGHPSVYTGRGTSFEDCSHWCLAGVPDTWNEILYAALLGN